MCVIVYKPAKVEVERQVLEDCAKANKDLMGAMYFSKVGVCMLRGYNKLDSLLGDLPRNWRESDVAFHFRIATSGKVNVTNSHPYPLRNINEEADKRWVIGEAGVMHNGIIPIKADKNKSDTFTMLRTMSDFPYENLTTVLDMVSNATKSRFLTFYSNGDNTAHFSGEWFEAEGVYFSNMYWETPKYSIQKNLYTFGAR